MHGFTDASSQAYAGVISSLAEINNGYAVILIMGKTRVAPIKTISFLCLQLNAAHPLSNCISLVKQLLTVPTLYCWSDYKIILHGVLWTEEEASLEVMTDPQVNLHLSDEGNLPSCLISKTSS